MDETVLFRKAESLKKEIRDLPEVSSEVIEITAKRLEGLSYAPTTIIEPQQFLRATNDDIIEYIRLECIRPEADFTDICSETGKGHQSIRLEHISVLCYYYKQLTELRQDIPEAWDEVDELYVHD